MPRPDGRMYPSLVAGVAAAVLVLQLGSGGVGSVLLKLFLYVSFALFCFLLGGVGLLVRKSPPKTSRFDTAERQSGRLMDLFQNLMVRREHLL